MKPIIGISGSLIIDEGGMFPGYKRSYVNNDYIASVISAGGVPLMLPFNEDVAVTKAQVAMLDGLILSGGHDVSPLNYGEEVSQDTGDIFPERDQFELLLIAEAEKNELGILGICRGCQLLNVYHGGDLYQDLSNIPSSTTILKHNQGHRSDLATQTLEILPESKLFNSLKQPQIKINSFHHQVIKNVGTPFQVTAKTADGVIECIENSTYFWEVGVQWHPEMMQATSPNMRTLFKSFIQSVREKKQQEVG
ncbi:gamma-glutamyl-gamma-aminobutyrate hydrolase family protein [Vagococcus intermedius]|uniref:gamma-glutamyl-gamma-aminobutyrate hydrolase family protein n=1 Tax=Vagococcus intermedius TaxID=2991418 RepID=UPI003F593A84